MSFMSQLKAARKAAGLTQKQVAEKLGIDHTTYSGYETGKHQPDVRGIKRIASVLGTTGDVLLETGLHDLITSDIPLVLPDSPFDFQFSDDDRKLLSAYHAADSGTQAAVRKLLDIAPPSIEESKKAT